VRQTGAAAQRLGTSSAVTTDGNASSTSPERKVVTDRARGSRSTGTPRRQSTMHSAARVRRLDAARYPRGQVIVFSCPPLSSGNWSFPTEHRLTRSRTTLPNCSPSSVRFRETYRLSISGGFWPELRQMIESVCSRPRAVSRASPSPRLPKGTSGHPDARFADSGAGEIAWRAANRSASCQRIRIREFSVSYCAQGESLFQVSRM